jgi:hypothetical protein
VVASLDNLLLTLISNETLSFIGPSPYLHNAIFAYSGGRVFLSVGAARSDRPDEL